MLNRKSKIENRKLIHPLAAVGNEDREFFHHELGFAERADHVRARGRMPFLRHLFASVATPAFDEGISRKNATFDLRQLAVVQPGFACAIDIIAVIEHETGPVRVPKYSKSAIFT